MGNGGEDQEAPAPALPKALAVAVGLLALSCLLIFLPMVGPLLLFTVAPFAACSFAARVTGLDSPRGWLWLGLSAGGIISLVEAAIILSLAGLIGPVDLLEPLGLGLLTAITVSNLVSGSLGARRGAADDR